MIYTIIDVETTGKGNKITEISIFKYDGNKIIDEFTSLVNPNSLIPVHITALTGIDNSMVFDAPTFSEIAKNILDITTDTIFVAHNVNFDYNIIRNEFKAIGIDFRRKKLCTVRLSRKLLPGYPSYSLGKLCKSLNIPINNRHRARGDAAATVILFKMILEADLNTNVITNFLERNSKEAVLPSYLSTSIFSRIPNNPGIYYFKDKKGKIIYVGKAKNLKKRVLSHFYSKNKRSLEMCRETHNIDFELSGNELIALLMEDVAIKKNFPKYNKKSKRRIKALSLISYTDRNGIVRLALQNYKLISNPEVVFYNERKARPFLEKLCIENDLCPKMCGLITSNCEESIYPNCNGICLKDESSKKYNERVINSLTKAKSKLKNKVISLKGRNENEQAFIKIENGVYKGYGFIHQDFQIIRNEQLDSHLIPQRDNADIQYILNRYIN